MQYHMLHLPEFDISVATSHLLSLLPSQLGFFFARLGKKMHLLCFEVYISRIPHTLYTEALA